MGALTTITETFGRVSIHGVREELLMAQLAAAGLPPTLVPIPYPCPNEIYEARMAAATAQAKASGITHMIFGDLFLAGRAHVSRSRSSPAPASRRCFRCGAGRPPSSRAR